MNRRFLSFVPGTDVPLEPVLVGMVTAGLALVLAVADSLANPSEQALVLLLALLLLLAAGVAGLSSKLRPRLSRWLVVGALTVAAHLSQVWLGPRDSLILAAIPTTLAGALISVYAGALAAAGETAFMIFLLSRGTVFETWHDIMAPVLLVWTLMGIMQMVYSQVHQLSVWLERYYEAAQCSLDEARDRKVELEQALESYAQANRLLALANERTARLRAAAEEAQRAKTAFAASVSHELRTPLNMILGLVELMVKAPRIYNVSLTPKMREDLLVVHRNCEHLSQLISDVLDLTRVETRRLALHRERIDLHEIVDSSVDIVRPLLEKKRLGLELSVAHDLPQVHCDRIRIKQVVLNLLSNAARFTEDGRIGLAATRQNEHVLLSVSDTGPGVSPEDARSIFEPFSQGSGEFMRGKGGSGLGLSISKQFVELHGGRMWLESEVGVGSTFSFTIPIRPPSDHIARPGHMIREDWSWREGAFRAGRLHSTGQLLKPRVVVYDQAGTLYSRLASCSDEVEFVRVQDLAQLGDTLQECPAKTVILNVASPGAILPAVQAAGEVALETPIIGCSAPQHGKQAIEFGAAGYLVKPVALADLAAALQATGKPVRRLLVVDDDLDVLQLFRHMLQAIDDSLEVVTASTGNQALAELQHSVPDAILLDIIMPGMDGWDLLEAMAQDPRLRGTAVYFVTAQDPVDQPAAGEFALVAIGGGFSLSRLLGFCLRTSELLAEAEEGPGLEL